MPTTTTTKRKTIPAPTPIVRATPVGEMTEAELEAEYRSVDRQFSRSETKPLTKADRATIAAAKARGTAVKGAEAVRRPGRPATGVTTTSVNVSVDSQLLRDADAYAKKNGLKRTQLIAAGLRLAMANGVTVPGR